MGTQFCQEKGEKLNLVGWVYYLPGSRWEAYGRASHLSALVPGPCRALLGAGDSFQAGTQSLQGGTVQIGLGG